MRVEHCDVKRREVQIMAKEGSAFLNQVERDLVDDLKKIHPHAKSTIWLYSKPYSVFEGICRKAKKSPDFMDYNGIDPHEMTYKGVPVVSLAKRKTYTRRDLKKMDL